MSKTTIAKNNNKRQCPIIKSRRVSGGGEGAFDNNRFLPVGRKKPYRKEEHSG